jgi:hypothetical protein
LKIQRNNTGEKIPAPRPKKKPGSSQFHQPEHQQQLATTPQTSTSNYYSPPNQAGTTPQNSFSPQNDTEVANINPTNTNSPPHNNSLLNNNKESPTHSSGNLNLSGNIEIPKSPSVALSSPANFVAENSPQSLVNNNSSSPYGSPFVSASTPNSTGFTASNTSPNNNIHSNSVNNSNSVTAVPAVATIISHMTNNGLISPHKTELSATIELQKIQSEQLNQARAQLLSLINSTELSNGKCYNLAISLFGFFCCFWSTGFFV